MSLNNVTVRYWFNCDCTGQGLQAWVDWAGWMPSGQTVTTDVQTSVGSTSLGGQTGYILYTFTGNLVLQPGQSIEVQSRFNKSDWSNMLQNNDWSFAANTGFANDSHVTGYIGGALVWGQEPTTAAPAAQTVNLLAFPNPSSGTGVNLSVGLAGASSLGVRAAGVSTGVDPEAVLSFRAYTLDGQLVWVKTVTEASLDATGNHSLYWNERNLANQSLSSGMYILVVTVKSGIQSSTSSTKILILK